MSKITAIFVLLTIATNSALASKILVLNSSPSYSHSVTTKALSLELAQRGHEVTVVSQFPLEKPLKNYRDVKITVENSLKPLIDQYIKKNGSPFKYLPLMPSFVKVNTDSAEAVMNNPEFQKIMKEETFDLVIFVYYLNNFLMGVADHFKCPQIVLSPVPGFDSANLIGNPTEISATANLAMAHKGYMQYHVRKHNFVSNVVFVLFNFFNNRKQSQLYSKYFPSDHHVSYSEIHQNISAVLRNSYFSQEQVRANVPGMIEVGGLQIPKPSLLPKDLQKWMDESENGVIYFSLGSNVDSSAVPKATMDIFMKTLGNRKERVIFKWAEEIPGKPSNVLVQNWVPQNDILADPKTKLFVSHCGYESVAESLYHAVPMVCVPVFGDQIFNAPIVEDEGRGINVPFKSITAESFSKAVKEVLEDPKFKSNVMEQSKVYKDRPQSALETAVFWTEYVIRNHGARFMQYPGALMNFLQRVSIDVIAFIIVLQLIVRKIIIKRGFGFVKRRVAKFLNCKCSKATTGVDSLKKQK